MLIVILQDQSTGYAILLNPCTPQITITRHILAGDTWFFSMVLANIDRVIKELLCAIVVIAHENLVIFSISKNIPSEIRSPYF